MGGKKKRGFGGMLKGVASDIASTSTAGIVDVDKKKVGFNPEDAGNNFLNASTYSGTSTAIMNDGQELPSAEDPILQENNAELEAKRKLEAEIGGRATGLQSTVLGGSTGTGNTKKKKLLGE